MNISESEFLSLPVAEQVFIVINEERIDRGLTPVAFVTSQLNGYAQQGADAATDPSFPAAVTGGNAVTFGGSIWAGGVTSVLETDYYWMYDDGWSGLLGATSNMNCSLASSSGCWGHRDIILHAFPPCGATAPTLSIGAAVSTSGYPGGSIAALVVSTCGAPPTDVTLSWSQLAGAVSATSSVVGIAALAGGQGYWQVRSNGAVTAAGQAINYGSMQGDTLNSPIVGIATTPDGRGYWLVAADGGIFSFGDASFFGSTGTLRLDAPMVGIAATPDGRGYWLIAADGGIFSFGDAPFRGSMGGSALNRPVVGIAIDASTGGYWLVAADGGIFSFDAPFFGSTGALRLVKPIVGMVAQSNGRGYRFVAADGGVFCFGGAAFDGSLGNQSLPDPVVAMAADLASSYWMATSNGGIFAFGGASVFANAT